MLDLDRHCLILGATGIGKTALSLRLAREFGREIISVDAFQVYKGMDIGTAKVSKEIRAEIPHHLIDIKSVQDPYSVYEFMQLSNDILAHHSEKKYIFCGGTGLFSQALLFDYDLSCTPISDDILSDLQTIYNRDGVDPLYQELIEADPSCADWIHPNNHKRVLRGVAVFRQTGKTPSQTRGRRSIPRDDIQVIGVTAGRDVIYERINMRVDQMIADGLIEEVRSLLREGVDPQCNAFQAIGYKEVVSYLDGHVSYEDMIELVKKRSRHLAKRQLTWYRQVPNVKWIKTN